MDVYFCNSMKHFLIVIFFFTLTVSSAQNATIVKWAAMNDLLHQKNDTTYVINFWATWCKPCVGELPYFLDQEKKLSNNPVKFYFISLDFKKDFSTRLIPFLQKQNITSSVFLLDEPDYNAWIDKVDSSWGGAIPGTLIYNSSKRKRQFYEKDFTAAELEQTLKQYIQ